MFQSILHPPGAERNMSRHSSVTRALAPAIALLGWTALLLQLALSLRLTMESGHGLGYGLMVYFGFFTILTNLLAAVTLTAPLLAPGSALGRTLSRPGVVTAVTGYMVLVGVTYSLLLRRLWAPTGWQKVADIALHDALPLLVLAYWWVAVPKAGRTASSIRACWATAARCGMRCCCASPSWSSRPCCGRAVGRGQGRSERAASTS
jgi:hypothetical protein